MRTINVFLSHRWSNDQEYQKINEWLQSSNYAIFKMYSVSKNEKIQHNNKKISDNELHSILEKRIALSSIFVAFNDKSYSPSYENWSKTELKIARQKNKKIFIIKRQAMDEIPSALIPNNGIASWQKDSVISKIKELTY